jgi:hypothetical protein
VVLTPQGTVLIFSSTKSAPSNVDLGCVYLQIVVESCVFSRSLLERVGVLNTLADSIDFYVRSSWESQEVASSLESALTMMRAIKRSIGKMGPCDHALRFDMAIASGPDSHSILPPVGELILVANSRCVPSSVQVLCRADLLVYSESLDWLCLIAVVQLCSWVIYVASKRPIEVEDMFWKNLLTGVEDSMNWVDMPDRCRDHARMAYNCLTTGDFAISHHSNASTT